MLPFVIVCRFMIFYYIEFQLFINHTCLYILHLKSASSLVKISRALTYLLMFFCSLHLIIFHPIVFQYQNSQINLKQGRTKIFDFIPICMHR